MKLPIVPVPLGLVSHKGDDKTLNLSNYEMGNHQAKALGEALKYSKAEKLTVLNNRLNSDGAETILRNVNSNLRMINLSNNNLNDLSKLQDLFNQKFAKSEAGREVEIMKTQRFKF